MNLEYSADERSFREQVRSFLSSSMPDDIRRRMFTHSHVSKEDVVRWQRILFDKGWAVPHWPRKWGGTGWTAVQRYIFNEEMLQWPAPEPLSFNTVLVGPVLIAFGNDEQKRRFLRNIASLEWWFCQGFSEPGAGSDLAALRTQAVRDGDHYVVNGQKLWTSTAHWADWMFALVRTSTAGKKQEGISFLLIDMKTPGIEVRRVRTIDGVHHTNEVFLTDVRVPITNRIGEENKGWDYAKFLLGNERTGVGRLGVTKWRLRYAKALAARRETRHGPLSRERSFMQEVANIEIEMKAMEMTAMRLLDAERHKASDKPNPMSSVLKIKGAEMQQRVTELLVKIAGPHALPAEFGGNDPERAINALNGWVQGLVPTYFTTRASSIFGGSNEIQRNILAKAILGL